MKLIREFKDFAMRGNVLDIAVGIIIGAAFGKIVNSMVDGILMPLIGLILGGINIADKKFTVGAAVLKWGSFLQSIVDFTIIAFAIFLMVKIVNSLKKEEKKSQLSTQETLLTEIRDILKTKV